MVARKPSRKKLLPSTSAPPGSFVIHKPYGDPVRCQKTSDVKRVLGGDMTKLADHLSFFGNDADKAVFNELQSEVGKLIEAGTGEVNLPYDTYSGLRYRARVEVVA